MKILIKQKYNIFQTNQLDWGRCPQTPEVFKDMICFDKNYGRLTPPQITSRSSALLPVPRLNINKKHGGATTELL
jgi:hypothetical protein